MFAIFLTIVFPGLGHMYIEQYRKGILIILLSVTPLYPLTFIYALSNTIKIYKLKRNKELEKKEVLILIISLFIIVPVILFIFFEIVFWMFSLQNPELVFEKRTKRELIEISETLDKLYYANKAYPKIYKSIYSKRPLRINWKNDEWGTNYKYKLLTKTEYELCSAGNDLVFKTRDDIVIKGRNGISTLSKQ